MRPRISSRLARAMELTNIKKEITYAELEATCLEGLEHRVACVVVPSALVRRAADALRGSEVRVGCYVGYPFGTQAPAVKAREAEVAVSHGAREIELVPHFGAVQADRWDDVKRELEDVRAAGGEAVMKLVVEASVLGDDPLAFLIRLAVSAGYRWISNTCGFRIVSTRPETEATASPAAIKRLHRLGTEWVRWKAAGRIQKADEAAALIEAGAERVGVSMGPGMLRRWAEEGE